MKNKKSITELLEKSEELKRKHEKEYQELINNENIPIDVRNKLKEIHEKLDKEMIEYNEDYQKYLDANKGKKILRYDVETFMPIFED